MSEARVEIRNGELIIGVLDKQQYGATTYGLIHCVYEVNVFSPKASYRVFKLNTAFVICLALRRRSVNPIADCLYQIVYSFFATRRLHIGRARHFGNCRGRSKTSQYY